MKILKGIMAAAGFLIVIGAVGSADLNLIGCGELALRGFVGCVLMAAGVYRPERWA